MEYYVEVGLMLKNIEETILAQLKIMQDIMTKAWQAYKANRWVTESANQADGSGSFGRKAQRKVIVQAPNTS